MTTNKDFTNSVNKFFFYINNYQSVEITYPSISGGTKKEYMPNFFKVFPPYLVEHLWNKFCSYCEDTSTANAIIFLYGQMDNEQRVKMLEFVNTNYNQSDLISE